MKVRTGYAEDFATLGYFPLDHKTTLFVPEENEVTARQHNPHANIATYKRDLRQNQTAYQAALSHFSPSDDQVIEETYNWIDSWVKSGENRRWISKLF